MNAAPRAARYARVARAILAVGDADRLNRAHNVLFRPEDLTLEQGYLIFMVENESVVHWGIAVTELARPDPPVWQRVNGVPPEWYSEGMEFSAFITKNLEWQMGIPESGEPG